MTRLILNCQGSAFQKLQLPPDRASQWRRVLGAKLIELLGGQWGRIPLEKQYEEAEQALFHTIQRQDESNDSFLARADVMRSRLLARKMTLQAGRHHTEGIMPIS